MTLTGTLRKAFATTLAAAMLIGTLAGCSSNANSNASSNAKNSSDSSQTSATEIKRGESHDPSIVKANGKYYIFGSHRDMDHIYNTPRAWFMGRFLAPHTYRWDGENADFTPESDDIPWSYVPERKVAAEDIQYLLSSHYQGTPYDPYAGRSAEKSGIYRLIGINRTGVTTICQIRSDVPDEIKGVEWVCFGSTTFSAWLPVYTNVSQMPDYLSKVTLDAETDNLYWVSRFVGALADKCYGSCIQSVWGYQDAVNIRGRQLILKYDKLMRESGDFTLTAQANDELCAMAQKESTQILNKVLRTASEQMKNGFSFADTCVNK